MPNNKMVAEQRALSLKSKFKRDGLFHSVYVNSVNDVISKCYDERVPDEDLGRCDGKVWYVPHHGVYHPQKRKLQSVRQQTRTQTVPSLRERLPKVRR